MTDEPSQTFFISYRRDDAAGFAGRLGDTLRQSLGEGNTVLRDVDQMSEPGADFKLAIAEAIERCDAVLAVIGPRWATITGLDGVRRLDDERDLVRLELVAALDHGIPVIPVLVDGATMPREQDLPAALSVIAARNAVELTDSRWKSDTNVLIEALREHAGGRAGADASRALPIPATALLGRQQELAEVDRMLTEGVRLITLTGPGGIGKTRIALEAAKAASPDFEKLVFCDLTTVDDPDVVLSTVARAAGIQETGEGRLIEVVARSLGPVPSLLVLDNFEHLLAAGATLAELLSLAGGLQALVTSRAVLRISGEREQPIASLSESDAVLLFTERAQAVRPDLELGAGELQAVTEICARLDGLPLAIELAAARVRLLSPEAMLDHLGERLALLTHGPQDAPERQQTVRATIEWSYRLLDEPDRALLARTSVFAGGATLAAIRAVCAPDRDAIRLLDQLQSLAENSLIFTREDEAGEERFRMLELIHEFAWRLVAEEDEVEELRRRHAHHFGEFADRLGPSLASSELVAAFAGFDADYANLIEALEWARGAGDDDLELGLLAWLANYWYLRGSYAESWPWFEHALGLQGGSPDRRAAMRRGAGDLRARMGDIDGARQLFEASLEIYEELGDLYGQARCFSGLEGCYARTEDFELAEQMGSRVLEIVRMRGDRGRLAFAASNAGYTAMQRGELARARELFDESAEAARELDHPEAIANVDQNRGLLALLEDDLDLATELTAAGLEGSLALGEHLGILASLVGAAAILARRGERSAAARLIALVDAELKVREYVLDPVEAQVRDQTVELVEAALSAEEIGAATAEGSGLELFVTTRRTIAELRGRSA